LPLFWKRKSHIEGDKEEPQHLAFGRWGEKVAEDYLKAQGLKILGDRVFVGRKDELDLLVRDGETLVFVEVKARKNELYGRPSDAVDRQKRYHLSRAAIRYMEKLKKKPNYFRFDIVEVIGELEQADPEIRHLKSAFTLSKPFKVTW
jgi:putative endonuclease